MLDEFRSTSITWDKATRRIYSPITANASDSNGRKLNIQVVNSGQVENLTGATLHLYWETKDKVHDGLDAFTASDISKGEFEIFYTTGMLSNVGELNATLVLVDSTGKVVSDWFKITVTRGINEGAIESENSFSSLTQALIDISNLEQNYAPRLNDLTAQLQQKNELGYFLGIKNFDNKYIERKSYEYYDLYDGLLSDVRLSKTTLGLDQSNLLPINLYTYTPSNYDKTIFVTCAIHGWEHYGSFLMYHILKALIHDGNLPTQFADLREARLLIIPVANPWGLDSTEHLGIRRGNAQGVDVNRNFDFNWQNNEGAYGLTKGSAPFSEKESQHIKHVFDNYDIDFYVDLHNFNDTPENVKDYEFNGYDSIATNTVEFITWLERRYPNSNVNHVKTTINSSANNYASQVLNVPAMNLEMVSGRYGLDDERKWYELVINYLAFQARSKTVNGTKVFTGLQHAGTSSVPTTWTDIDFYKAFYKVENDGMFIFTGYLTLTFVGEAIATIAPEFYQSQGNELKLISGADRFKPMLKVKDGVYTLPYTFIYPAKKIDGDAYFNLKIIKEGAGTVNFFRIGKSSAFLPGNLTDFDNLQLVP